MSSNNLLQLLQDICEKHPEQIEPSLQCIDNEKEKARKYIQELDSLKSTLLQQKSMDISKIIGDDSFLYKWGC
jgi:flagellar biosynthesis chaperone FliJ